MPLHLAVAGKGGTGKTTLAALIVRYLVERGKGPVLAVDADPNANLNEAMGLEVTGTIADLLASMKDGYSVPPGMTKDMYIEYRLNAALTEGEAVDLLVMGGPEGPGCYCFPNDVLKRYVQRLSANYRYLVMDNEAGLEHLSRRIAQDVDVFLVTSDATARGVRSAGRVKALIDALSTRVGRMYLVLTRAGAGDERQLREEIERTGLELAGIIPADPLVSQYDLEGRPLSGLPAGAAAVRAVEQLCDRVLA
ncbi:MAG TPA: carbon monoxide dehydrogenase [Clostridiales bacterium UBA8153]|nr:carbon monoxide dehydrogenase [Clostridiales bacterium UBA8153]